MGSLARCLGLSVVLGCGPPTEVEPPFIPSPPPTMVDVDGDGFSPPEDCDDNNPIVLPTEQFAHLICDGVDNDCDGVLEGEIDQDGDGWSPCDPGECDDSNPQAYLGAPDALGDGVDQDCDGTDGVGLLGTPVLDGELRYAALGFKLERADVDGDGCDDLVLSNGGAINLSNQISNGSNTHLRILRGCGQPVIDFSPELIYSGFGNRLAIWPQTGADRVIVGTAFDNFDTVHVIDFSVDPPILESLLEATEVGEIYGFETLQRGGEWYLAVGQLNTNEPSGPIRVYPLPLGEQGYLQDLPHEQWLPGQPDWQTNWRILAYDRDQDGDDELFTQGSWFGTIPEQAGELYGLDGPGELSDAAETWVSDISLGYRFGLAMYPAPDLRGGGERWLLSGSVNMRDAGALYALPPLGSGVFSVLDAPFSFEGEYSEDWLGHDGVVGDVNGDGITDVVIGAPGNNWRDDQRGKVFVFFGPFDSDRAYTRQDALVFVGERPDDHFGMRVELADLDGDGAVEIYASAPLYNPPGSTTLSESGRLYRLDLP